MVINEIELSAPHNETVWVELYNANSTTVDLIDWYIDDAEDMGGAPKDASRR